MVVDWLIYLGEAGSLFGTNTAYREREGGEGGNRGRVGEQRSKRVIWRKTKRKIASTI